MSPGSSRPGVVGIRSPNELELVDCFPSHTFGRQEESVVALNTDDHEKFFHASKGACCVFRIVPWTTWWNFPQPQRCVRNKLDHRPGCHCAKLLSLKSATYPTTLPGANTSTYVRPFFPNNVLPNTMATSCVPNEPTRVQFSPHGSFHTFTVI